MTGESVRVDEVLGNQLQVTRGSLRVRAKGGARDHADRDSERDGRAGRERRQAWIEAAPPRSSPRPTFLPSLSLAVCSSRDASAHRAAWRPRVAAMRASRALLGSTR